MKINVTQQLKDYEGKPLQATDSRGNKLFKKGEDGKQIEIILTLKDVLLTAINYFPPPAVELPPNQKIAHLSEQKYKAYKLAKQVAESEEVEFDPNDLTRIKDNLAQIYPPVIVGQVFSIFDEKETNNADHPIPS